MAFDPDKFLESGSAEESSKSENKIMNYFSETLDKWAEVDPVGAANTFLSGATLGMWDEVAGGLKSVTTDMTYQEARDMFRNNIEEFAKANPTLSPVLEVGGAIATGGIGAQGFGRLMIEAGIAGAGYSDNDIVTEAGVNTQAIPGLLKDVAESAAIGGIAGKTLDKGLDFLRSRGTQKKVANSVFESLSPSSVDHKSLRTRFGKDYKSFVGGSVLQEAVESGGSTLKSREGLLEMMEAGTDRVGSEIGGLVKQADELIGTPVVLKDDLITRLRSRAGSLKSTDPAEDALLSLTKKLEAQLPDNMNLGKLHEVKSFQGKIARGSGKVPTEVTAEGSKRAREIIRQETKQMLEESLGIHTPELLPEITALNTKFGNQVEAKNILESAVARDAGVDLKSVIGNVSIATAAATLGSPVVGAGLIGGRIATKKYGSQAAASLKKTLGKIGKPVPNKWFKPFNALGQNIKE